MVQTGPLRLAWRAFIGLIVALCLAILGQNVWAQNSVSNAGEFDLGLRTPCNTLMVDMSGSMRGFQVAGGSGPVYRSLLQGLSGRCGGNAYPFTAAPGARSQSIWTPPANGATTDLAAALRWWLAGSGKEPGQTLILLTDNVADLEATGSTPGSPEDLSIACEGQDGQPAAQTKGANLAANSQRDFICALRNRGQIAAASVVLTRLPFEGPVYPLGGVRGVNYKGPRALAIYVIRSGQRLTATSTKLDDFNTLSREIVGFLGRAPSAQYPINPFNPMAQSTNGQSPAAQKLWAKTGDSPSWRQVSANQLELPETSMGTAMEFRVLVRISNGDMWSLSKLQGEGRIKWEDGSAAKPRVLPIEILDGSSRFGAGVCKPLTQTGKEGQKTTLVSLGPGETACPIMVFRLDEASFADGRSRIDQLKAWISGKPVRASGVLDIKWQADRKDLELAGQVQSGWNLDAGTDLSSAVPEVQGRIYRLNDILRMAAASDDTSERSVAFSPAPVKIVMSFIPGTDYWLTLMIFAAIVIVGIVAFIWGLMHVFRTALVSVSVNQSDVGSGVLGPFSELDLANGSLSRFGPIYAIRIADQTGLRFFGAGPLTLRAKAGQGERRVTISHKARN